MDYSTNGGVWKVYASKDYDEKTPRMTNYVEVNLPEYMPTIPQDGEYTNISVRSNYFVNKNFPKATGTLKSVHSISLPLLKGTTCPVYFLKGTQFLLYTPTSKMEEGFLLYIGEGS